MKAVKSAARHRVAPPSRTGLGALPALASRQRNRDEIPSMAPASLSVNNSFLICVDASMTLFLVMDTPARLGVIRRKKRAFTDSRVYTGHKDCPLKSMVLACVHFSRAHKRPRFSVYGRGNSKNWRVQRVIGFPFLSWPWAFSKASPSASASVSALRLFQLLRAASSRALLLNPTSLGRLRLPRPSSALICR